MQTLIYADHAATTSLSPVAFAAMEPWFQEKYGNPSTLYSFAREPRRAIANARIKIAECINAKPEEIFFTSGGTEADNWALTGIAFRAEGLRKGIITSSIEHHAVLNCCKFLHHLKYDITYLPVNKKGVITPDVLEEYLEDNTLAVSIMMANNEIGTLQPIKELADVSHKHQCIFHTDAVQAVGHIPIDVKHLNVDMLSASAHKFNGPKGVGFLFIKEGVDLEPLLHGGTQEKGRRAGTENVAGIVGMAEALLEHNRCISQEMKYLNTLSSNLVSSLRKHGLDFIINGGEKRIPGSLSLSFRNTQGEMLLHRLDLMGTAVATGSACDSVNNVLSHVIQAIGVPPEYASGTIRITLGTDNTLDQMMILADQINLILKK